MYDPWCFDPQDVVLHEPSFTLKFRRPKNLQDYLVHVRLRPVGQSTMDHKGTFRCNNSRCDVCNYVILGDSFSSHVTNSSYRINYQLDCNSRNVVYLISCKVCGLQYVGSTTTEFRLRFNNHKSRLKTHARMSAADRDSDDCVYRHFYDPGHHGLVDVSVKLIDKVNDKDRLIEKEGQWAYRLRSLKPEGLNDSDFFFSQNRRGRRH